MKRSSVSEPTRLRSADAIAEALASIVARPVRALLASFGIGVGVAWFVVVLGLVSTATGHVTTLFASRLATQVTVRPLRTGPVPAAFPYPAGVERRLDAVDGVVAAGVYWQVRLGRPVTVAAGPAGLPAGSTAGKPGPGQAVIAASPGFLSAAGVQIGQGRRFGAWAQAHAAPVCLLGSALARALGITTVRGQPALDIGQEPCVVIGIISRAIRRPGLLRAVLLPSATALALWGPPDGRDGARPAVLIQTRPGAAPVVARQAAYAISPARPHQFAVVLPDRPQRLRDQVTGTLASLYTILLWVSLGTGLLVIAGVSWLFAAGRTAEYVLRRSVGARRRHILMHVMWESAIVGLLGGMAGASLGLAVVVLVANGQHAESVVAPLTVLLAPLAGAAAGVLAGLVPAVLAARVQPALALSRSSAA